jgi:hypothetical protein
MKITKQFLLEDYYDEIEKELEKNQQKYDTEDALYNKVLGIYRRYQLDTLDNKPNSNTNIFKPIEDEIHNSVKDKTDDELRDSKFDFVDILVSKIIKNGSYKNLK